MAQQRPSPWATPNTNYHGKCGNCHGKLQDEDRYCRFCGTIRGAGKFEPYYNTMERIYGPRPVRRVHRCTGCGNSWSTYAMVDREKFCPRCGAPSEIAQSDNE